MKDKKIIKSDNQFPVVGIGASAGGLDAFKKLLKAIPENSGMAYVLVQHLDPKHDSILPELLQKVTRIPVLEISDDIKVMPDHIYVIPSNKMMEANDGILKLTPRQLDGKNKLNLPIDLFFTSLAEVHQTHAIGVVLSGTASDGTAGLKAIKDHGGITFAQDSQSAGFDSMPNSAVNAGVVDFVLMPDKIPQKIAEIVNNLNGVENDDDDIPEQDENIIKKILSLLRIRKGTDFTYYKQTTVRRRIFRRMVLSKYEQLADYLKFVRDNKLEIDVLYQDLLIPVTSFFRDQEVFNSLCETVFPQIIKEKPADEAIRIWIAGCSTGEEVYSVAMCFKEFFADTLPENSEKKIQLFATDLSGPAIDKARNGIYTSAELSAVSTERLNAFFTRTNGGYRVNKQIRDMCVFAVHNFLKDPPFGKLDVISCRNVLIYMEPYLQKKALTTFHYALNPKGILLLGKSETVSSVPGLFIASDKSHKIFTRKDVPGKFIPIASSRSESNMNNINSNQKKENTGNDYLKIADDILLKKYTPAGVVVNEMMDIIHFRGNTAKFLEQLPGKPSHNLLKMARQGLGFELRSIIHKAKKELTAGQSIRKENISLQIEDSLHTVAIEAIVLPNTIEPCYLVLFHDTNPIVRKISSKAKKDEKDIHIQQLEKELTQIHEDMRSITEEQEAANEELQSDNEELLSTGEELQSLNEELETSKEELQSTNEELMVVNQEIINLNEQITEARDYAEAIVDTIHESMIILDRRLRVKSANKAFYKNFSVSEGETIGNFLYDLGNKQWDIPILRKLLDDIISKNAHLRNYEITHTFQDIGRKTMLLNANQLVQKSQGEQLILLAIHDITESRSKALELERIETELLKKNISENKLENVRLEKAVNERTRELTSVNKELVIQYVEKEKRAEELIIANKELAFQNIEKEKRAEELLATNEELSAFTYIASHDLQEPLRKTQLFISRILDDKELALNERSKDYFNRIQISANRMQLLINDLLAYSRITETKESLSNINLNDIIQNVLLEPTLIQTIEATNTTVNYSNLPTIQGVSFQLEQLFTNLIINSIKYSDTNRSPVINIKCKLVESTDVHDERADPAKKYYHISVSDNGIGFEQQYAEKIFMLFQRLHDKQTFSGTGIGLTICKKIVENHNGFISAKSISNYGTTIDIYLPTI